MERNRDYLYLLSSIYQVLTQLICLILYSQKFYWSQYLSSSNDVNWYSYFLLPSWYETVLNWTLLISFCSNLGMTDLYMWNLADSTRSIQVLYLSFVITLQDSLGRVFIGSVASCPISRVYQLHFGSLVRHYHEYICAMSFISSYRDSFTPACCWLSLRFTTKIGPMGLRFNW